MNAFGILLMNYSMFKVFVYSSSLTQRQFPSSWHLWLYKEAKNKIILLQFGVNPGNTIQNIVQSECQNDFTVELLFL